METKFNNFTIKEMVKIDKIGLTNKIGKLKKWLSKEEGLGMMYVIDDIMKENYETKITSEEINKFNNGLNELRKTDFPYINSYLSRRVPGGITNKSIVKINGKWSYVNKLNANYSDQADLLVYLIERLLNDEHIRVKNEYGVPIYDTIMSGNVEKGLLILKPKLKEIIEYYLIKKGQGLKDFLFFTKNSKRNSEKGEIAEGIVKDFLIKKGFDIKHEGGDGDFIDMTFGCDFIVYREDVGYKTIQVKSFEPSKEEINYYKVNWIVVCDTYTKNVKIIDKNTFQPINLD